MTLSTGTAVPNDGSTANGQDLVIITSSLASSSVIATAGGAKFLRSPVPVIVWESALEDDFSFQAAGGGTTDAQTQINIVNASHPLAAGFPAGLLTVTTSPQTFSQGAPVGARIVATRSGPTLALLIPTKGEKGFNGFVMRHGACSSSSDHGAAVNAAAPSCLTQRSISRWFNQLATRTRRRCRSFDRRPDDNNGPWAMAAVPTRLLQETGAGALRGIKPGDISRQTILLLRRRLYDSNPERRCQPAIIMVGVVAAVKRPPSAPSPGAT